MAGPDEKATHPDIGTGGRRRASEEASVRPDGQPERRDQGQARLRNPAAFRQDITRFQGAIQEGYEVLKEAHGLWKRYTEARNMLPTQVQTEKAKEKEIYERALKVFLRADTELRQLYTPLIEYIMRRVEESEKAKDENLKERILERRWDGRGRVAMALFRQTSLALGFLSAFINEEDQDEDFQKRYRGVVEEQKARLEQIPFSTGSYMKLGQAMRRAADFRSFDQMTRLSSQIVQEFLDSPDLFMEKYAEAGKRPVPTSLS